MSALSFTSEQSSFIQDPSRIGIGFCRAGTGKTTCLEGYARANAHERILYVVFNRANREEAAQRFPSNTAVCTSHQLAMKFEGYKLQHKLRNGLRLRDIYNFLEMSNWSDAKLVENTLLRFLASSSSAITTEHCSIDARHAAKRDYILYGAKTLWLAMIDPNNPFQTTHDVYLKLYQLTKPDLSYFFDTILFDEFQDANPVTADIICSQLCKLRFVGDDHQQIYRFRGAVDASKNLKDCEVSKHYFTQSFRFGPVIADLANKILWHKGEQHLLRGLESICSKHVDALPKGHYTSIQRTISGTLEVAINSMKGGKKLWWVGGIKNYDLDSVLDVFYLSVERFDKIKNKRLLAEFKNYYQYKSIAKESTDHEMELKVKLVEKYPNLPELVDALTRSSLNDEEFADVTVTTAHRAKGMEWSSVMIYDDFPDLTSDRLDDDGVIDEINLLYVTLTRAINFVVTNSPIDVLLRLCSEGTTIWDHREKVLTRKKDKPFQSIVNSADNVFFGAMATGRKSKLKLLDDEGNK